MHTPVRVCLIGAAGRLGRKIVDAAAADDNIDIVSKVSRGDSLAAAMKNCDVAVDVSSAAALADICEEASKWTMPLVIGTTGHSVSQREIIDRAKDSLPIVVSSNFSVGVNALFWLTERAAGFLREFNVQIAETHHVMKKDAPSGTAKTLAEAIERVRKSESPVKIESSREGEVIGDHTVRFETDGEEIELTHRARDRAIFAVGALRAAKWVVGKPAGLYTMRDVLGLINQ